LSVHIASEGGRDLHFIRSFYCLLTFFYFQFYTLEGTVKQFQSVLYRINGTFFQRYFHQTVRQGANGSFPPEHLDLGIGLGRQLCLIQQRSRCIAPTKQIEMSADVSTHRMGRAKTLQETESMFRPNKVPDQAKKRSNANDGGDGNEKPTKEPTSA
jgi:hypothetical protein